MDLAELDYEHPEASIAQRPSPTREGARLLVVRQGARPEHGSVDLLRSAFGPGDLLVLNETRVRPGRAFGRKESGARVELLLLEQRGRDWLALIRSSRSPRPGTRLVLDEGPAVEVIARERELFLLRPPQGEGLERWIESHGRVPLPPYIRREADEEDAERYQTVFATAQRSWTGAGASAAAPTAGLHLTREILTGIEETGARVLRVRLGVGAGTFRPIREARVEGHRMHEEAFEIPEETASALEAARLSGGRLTAVGTTTLRALEAAATPSGRIRSGCGRTGLFLLPGASFRTAQRLLTNFHQPRSSLLALVMGFAGTELVRAAYAEALTSGYRLFSYGDAMFLERAP